MNAAPPLLPTILIPVGLAGAMFAADLPPLRRLGAAWRGRRARAQYRRLRRFDLSVIEHLAQAGRIDRRKRRELEARSRRIRSAELEATR